MDWHPLQTSVPGEFSPTLLHLGAINGFSLRQPHIDTHVDRALAVERLAHSHHTLQQELGLDQKALCLAEQIHGDTVAILRNPDQRMTPGVDALVTEHPAICLGIFVADCCAVFALDPEKKAIGLAHSGAKGTRLGVVPKMLQALHNEFGSSPSDLIVVLSPCIRPPFYEVDFAQQIHRQCREFGVQSILDPGICTASNTDRYYSYRTEQGKTGRMLALLALR